MDFGFLPAWDEFLPREGGHVVSLFGGGGKTSLLRAIAGACRGRGVPVLLTCTTRTEPLAWPELEVLEAGAEAAGRGTSGPVPFLRDGVLPDGKWRGLSPAAVDELGRTWPGHVAVVEADGSAGRPLKLHREGEPVWPRRTSLALAVVGLSAVGRPLREVLHRHEGPRPPWLGAAEPDAPWTWEQTFELLAGPGGYLARVPPGVPAAVVLSQLDDQADAIGLFAFAGRLMDEARVPLIVFAELGADPPRLRTAYRRTDEDES